MRIITWILQSILWIPGQIFIRYAYGYRVLGKEHLADLKDTERGVLFVANHRSQLDAVFVTASLPFFSRLRPLFFISLEPKEYYHLPLGRYLYGGFLFKIFGAYPAYRKLGDYAKTLRHHLALLGKGRSVCIFPEGGISKDGTIQKPRAGVSFLANTGAWVVPVHITGMKSITVHIGKPFVSRGETPEEIMGHVERASHGT